MEVKFTTINALKKGSYIQIDNIPCVVKNIDISKTGKHGHAKARIEAVGLLDGNKRVVVRTGHDNIPVPIIEKKRAQVLSITDASNASIMDLENFETLAAEVDEAAKEKLEEGKQVEYWKIAGKIIIKRVVS